ncbi:uncharacterized protein Dwil_GK24199 [Drosophila willistoni]|uniref:Uncharacterized protein n=1 Tax=Drosophila willistoni TaxID=7260 RepID=B4N1E5_DROWI|nr:uncharacterized protein LOC6643772 [Drosophila willistoni]EDW78082.1 uncharacterized protein Dwil_GK24199 [Drosophila willistoni]
MLIPEVNMVQVSRNARIQRKEILQFNMPGLKIIDYSEMQRLDKFFLDCQDLRDYYRDPDNKLHEPSKFRNPGRCGIKPDRVMSELFKPVEWVTQSKPVYNFIEKPPKSDMDLNWSPSSLMKGRYTATSCSKFKR